MTRSEIYSHVCPTCGAAAGEHCIQLATVPTFMADGHGFHAARVALATPQPTEVQRFAERLAEKLKSLAFGVSVTAPEADQVKAALGYVAYAVREAAKGQP